MRSLWTALTDDQLLSQCSVDTYRASGPGGQKRNKTSSAVRVRHPPSGLLAIAEESRSQHENRARALRRLREMLYLELREPTGDVRADLASVLREGRFAVGAKDARFWPAAARALDALDGCAASLRDCAVLVGTTTAPLVEFFRLHPKVWQEACEIRARHGQAPLR